MTKTKRQPGDIRRKQIKEAVKEILFSEGMHFLTTKNIARKVGISEGAVFKHFSSKKAIIDDILKDVREQLVEPLRKIASSKKPAPQRLEKFICFHIEYLRVNRGITLLLFTEASYQNDPDLKSTLDETYHAMEQHFAGIIRDGIREGAWDSTISVEAVSCLYMGIPLSLNIELSFHQGQVDEKNYCKKMLILLQRMLKKDAPSR
jgi:AcrR family transcriptional regulator